MIDNRLCFLSHSKAMSKIIRSNEQKEVSTVSLDIDYMTLKAISKLYRSRRSECPELKSFHDFTMNILRATELRPLETNYKEFIRKSVDRYHGDDDIDLIDFEGIEVSKDECYLLTKFYAKAKSFEGYHTAILKFGKFRKSPFAPCPSTLANIDDISRMTTVKAVRDIFKQDTEENA